MVMCMRGVRDGLINSHSMHVCDYQTNQKQRGKVILLIRKNRSSIGEIY